MKMSLEMKIKKDILNYLKKASQFSMFNIIGFLVIKIFNGILVTKYRKENKVTEPPEAASRVLNLIRIK